MNKKKRSGWRSRRIFGLLLSVVLILGMMPNAVYSAYADEAIYEEEISEETSTSTDTELVVTTEEPSTDIAVETNLDEESDMLVLYSTATLGADSAEPIAVALDADYPADEDGFCSISFMDNGSGDGGGVNTCGYDFGAGSTFDETPYWKNDPDHPGKIMPATVADYNLYYDNGTGELHLKGLNLSVAGEYVPAIMVDGSYGSELTIVIEEDSTITSAGGQAISAMNGSITFEGSGNLKLVTKKRDSVALDAWERVTHNGTGIITLEPAHRAWIGEVAGKGSWANTLPIDYIERSFSVDGVEHLGYSGFYINEAEWELYANFSRNEVVAPGPIYAVHGSTVQEVIDKLSGEIPTTFDNSKVSGVDIASDYIYVTASGTDYDYEIQEEQYVTSTRDFEGIIFYGSEEPQRTNHDPKENGTWVEDHVFVFDGQVKELFGTLIEEQHLTLESGIDLNSIEYLELYPDGTEFKIHIAEENPNALTPDKPYRFTLGEEIVDGEALVDAVLAYNDAHSSDGGFVPIDVSLDEWGLRSLLRGYPWEEDYQLQVKTPLPTLHINSQCDFIIAGDFDNVAQPKNEDDINVYFGFLPDANHKVSYVCAYEDDAEYEASQADPEFNGGRKHILYDYSTGAIDTERYLIDYTKEDLKNGTIKRGTMTIPISVWTENGVKPVDLKVLMYEHVTEEGTVSGNYPEAVTMDMTSIPDGKILGDIDITEDQLAVLETGESAVDIDLAVNELDTQAAANQTAVTDIASEATKGGYTDPFYMDLNLSASIRNAGGNKLAFANGAKDISLTELEKPVELTIEIPKEMQSANTGREYAIVRRHVTPDGKVQTEVLTVQYDAKTKSLTFKTDKFSTYAIVYKDATVPSTGTTTDTGTTADPGTNATTPGTGDNAPIEMAAVLILATTSMMVLCFKKRKVK